MPFNISTARPIEESEAHPKKNGGFDISTARPYEEIKKQPFSFSRMVENIPSSAIQTGKSMIQPIIHPIETARSLVDLITGGAETALGVKSDFAQEDKAKFNAMTQFLKSRYGGLENIKLTAESDPIGFLTDISSILGAGGFGIGKAGELSKISALSKTGKLTSKIGEIAEPISALGIVAEKAIMGKLPEKLYASALKLSTVLKPEERLKRIETGLKEGILPTTKGLQDLNEKIEGLNNLIQEKIVKGSALNQEVDASEIVKKIDELKPFYKNTVLPQGNIEALDEMKKLFQEAHGEKINLGTAQKIKQNTYALLRKSYGELKSVNVEGQKALARGIKDEIVKIYPEIQGLNQQESSLLALQESIERAVNRIENRDVIGIGSTIAGTAGATITGSHTGGALTYLAKSLLDHPEIKARLAIALNKSRQTTGGGIRRTLFQTGRIPEQTEIYNQEGTK